MVLNTVLAAIVFVYTSLKAFFIYAVHKITVVASGRLTVFSLEWPLCCGAFLRA